MNGIYKQTWFQCWMISIATFFLYNRIDSRELVDLGRYYQSIPDWVMWYQGRPSPSIFELVFQIGGWLNAVLSVFVFLDVNVSNVFAAYSIICSGIFWYSLKGRSEAGLWLILMQPIWQIGWRTHWIHALETSLLVWLWCQFEDRYRRWNGFVAFLLIWLRPSAIIWIFIFGVYEFSRGRSTSRLIVGTLIGGICIFSDGDVYLLGKLNLSRVDISLFDMVSSNGCAFPMGLSFISLKDLTHEKCLWLTWIMISIALVFLFGVGLDNFPLFFVGMALLSASVLKNMNIKWLSFVSMGMVFIPLYSGELSILKMVLHRDAVEENSFGFIRPMTELDETISAIKMGEVVSEICKPDTKKHCIVVSAGGLFHPHRESLGRLALVSPELSHVRIERAGMWFHRDFQLASVELAVIQECLNTMDADHPVDFLQRRDHFVHSVRNWMVFTVVEKGHCQWTFFTPDIQNLDTVPKVH